MLILRVTPHILSGLGFTGLSSKQQFTYLTWKERTMVSKVPSTITAVSVTMFRKFPTTRSFNFWPWEILREWYFLNTVARIISSCHHVIMSSCHGPQMINPSIQHLQWRDRRWWRPGIGPAGVCPAALHSGWTTRAQSLPHRRTLRRVPWLEMGSSQSESKNQKISIYYFQYSKSTCILPWHFHTHWEDCGAIFQS